MSVVVIGAGLAGLTAALALSPRPVIVLSAGKLGEACSSTLAQGGIAAAMGAGDTPAFHADDTARAGAGLCSPDMVRQVTGDAPAVIALLSRFGVPFDRSAAGELLLGLEGGHSHRRIIHAGGDSTGAAVMHALIAAVRATPSIAVMENTVAEDLLGGDAVTGVAVSQNGTHRIIAANAVVLATGGAGALWQHTTNPLTSWGSGLALAARAGAVLGDMEFVQFHPTAIDVGLDPMPLASEALRGEGAMLVDETGARFLPAGGELAPRDVVTMAIATHRLQGHRIFLDTRSIADVAHRFPSVYAAGMAAGIDPATRPIPIHPAAHYHMGGVVTDARGRTSIPGLWACGEAACTGLHGANRIASNSLLEAVSLGEQVARDIGGVSDGERGSPALPTAHRTEPFHDVRKIASEHIGVLRNAAGLKRAIDLLTPMASLSDRALVALMIAAAALNRTESRGAHRRSDYPNVSAAWAKRQTLTLARHGETWEPILGEAPIAPTP